MGGYAEREPWPDIDADSLRYRLTDRVVRDEVKLSPLSVSASARKREALLSEIEGSADWLRWQDDARDRCIESDDFLDAFLCALIARSAAVGLTVWPKKKKEWKAALAEGWIHLPRPDSLPQLAGASEKPPPGQVVGCGRCARSGWTPRSRLSRRTAPRSASWPAPRAATR